MGNMLRWFLCLNLGKEKGVIVFDSLMRGRLGQVVRNTDAALLEDALSRIGK